MLVSRHPDRPASHGGEQVIVTMGGPVRSLAPHPAWWWVALAALAVVIRLLSTGVLEIGDGVHHFQMALFSWQHPELILDMWGKPLFTLLSSPFAQLGIWGMTLFNALCFIGTCWAADGVLKQNGNAARWLFPTALLLVPVYGIQILAGMTEVLFGLLAVLAVRFAYDERPVAVALIISIMPFSRPEYIAFAPFAVFWLCWRRAWHALPFLLVGHLVYATFAWAFTNEPLLAFKGDPYVGASDIYGRGRLDHFISNFENTHGTLWYILVIALILAIIMLRSADPIAAKGRMLTWLTALPAFAIIMLHSILWWQGLKGSLGLLRVLGTAAPLLVLFTFWMLALAGSRLVEKGTIRTGLTLFLGALYLSAAAGSFLDISSVPIDANDQQRFLNMVGERVKGMRTGQTAVAYHSPYIGFRLELDPYSRADRAISDLRKEDLGLAEGDLLVWDAHFSPNEGRTPLHTLLEHPALRFVERFEAPMPMIVLGGRQFEVFIFERRDTERWSGTINIVDQSAGILPTTPYRMELDSTEAKQWTFPGNEFPFELTHLPVGSTDVLYGSLEIEGHLEVAESDVPLLLVFEERNGAALVGYEAYPLNSGPFRQKIQVSAKAPGTENKLYIWDRAERTFSLRELRINAYLHRSRPLGDTYDE